MSDTRQVTLCVTVAFADDTTLTEMGRSNDPARIPVIDPLTGGPLHVPAGVNVTLLYSSHLKAYIPYPRELLES